MACDQTWTFHEGELHRDDVQQLLAAHVAEMRASSPPDACHVLAADRLDDPAIRFFSMRNTNGGLVAIGALKRLDARHGEIKSMRVSPATLGRGAGRRMLDHLLGIARESEMDQVSLETGNHPLFTPARELYRRAGFRPCPPFGGYSPTPFTLFFTRSLGT